MIPRWCAGFVLVTGLQDFLLSEFDERFLLQLTDEIRKTWRAGSSMDAVLSRFVIATASRAAGCWRLIDGHLRLVGFGCAADMPADVSQGFQDVTRLVPLDQTGLGIVKAATSKCPAIGRRDSRVTGLDGSASWIAKFESNSSLAVPIWDLKTSSILGVIAISTGAVVEDGDSLWQTMIRLSQELGTSDPNFYENLSGPFPTA